MPFLTKYAFTDSARACDSSCVVVELAVGLAERLVVGVALDLELEVRELLEHRDRLVERLVRARQQVGRADLEVDALDDAGELLHLRRDLVRAAVLVLVAVLGLRLVRALVLRVGDAVAVVVRIRAAVGVLEAVLVLGLVRALVVRVGDAVVVVVRIGAAVVVLEAVLVLGLVRALVRARRGCRRRRCPDPGSRRRPGSRPCPRARSGTCPSSSGMPSPSVSFGAVGGSTFSASLRPNSL